MINFFLVLLSLVSLNSYALDLQMKPGLWEINMKIISGGKEINPLAELQKQLEKMPEAQRKMIMDQIAKQTNSKGNMTELCYTKEMIDNPAQATTELDSDSDCKHEIKSKTSTKIVSTFKCADGNSGSSVWELKSPTQMSVVVDSKDKKGKIGRMEYSAKFLKSSCK